MQIIRNSASARYDGAGALNHALPDQPNSACRSGTYGEITGWGGARTIQMSAKLPW